MERGGTKRAPADTSNLHVTRAPTSCRVARVDWESIQYCVKARRSFFARSRANWRLPHKEYALHVCSTSEALTREKREQTSFVDCCEGCGHSDWRAGGAEGAASDWITRSIRGVYTSRVEAKWNREHFPLPHPHPLLLIALCSLRITPHLLAFWVSRLASSLAHFTHHRHSQQWALIAEVERTWAHEQCTPYLYKILQYSYWLVRVVSTSTVSVGSALRWSWRPVSLGPRESASASARVLPWRWRSHSSQQCVRPRSFRWRTDKDNGVRTMALLTILSSCSEGHGRSCRVQKWVWEELEKSSVQFSSVPFRWRFDAVAVSVTHEASESRVAGRGPHVDAGHTQRTCAVRPPFLFALLARALWLPSTSEWRCFRAES